jgi:superfamily II DNA or RNA helicase
VKHLAILKQLLEQAIMDVPIYMLTSKMKNKVLHQELTDLKKEGRPFVLLTTGSYAGEGFDLPALDTLLLVMPISGKSSLQQYLGRLLRKLEDKNELRVYDYVDYAIPMLYRMYQKRLATYKKLGYHLYDDQMTELSRSNLFTDYYQEILFKDLKALKAGLLTLPYLSKAMFNALRLLNNPQQVTLLLPAVISIAEKKKVAYQLQLEQLQKIGYTIKFKRKIAQHFAVLNDEIVWMLPESREDSIALRLLSRDIAGRLVRYFGG